MDGANYCDSAELLIAAVNATTISDSSISCIIASHVLHFQHL